MAWGFFKKLVVADNVALIANRIFSLADPGFELIWAGTLAFSVQIYADFSAYSDIAIGAARLLGFDLMKNFDHPYLSQSPSEFWRRWHISLSTWFRDYVYIPLGGNRVSGLRRNVNLFATFLLSGFWHGASWNFVLWGGYHAFLLALYERLERRLPVLFRARSLAIPRMLVFFALTNIGWMMFRETDAQRLFANLTLLPGSSEPPQRLAAAHFLLLTLFYAIPLIVDDALATSSRFQAFVQRRPIVAECTLLVVLGTALTCFHSTQTSDFIYFQF
jgi:D-alanyl-lipoteichoic acid acyltransferase DltB (MBOAT superfamily)